MSRLIFNADTLGGTTTLSSADAVGNFTITVPAVNGTMSVKDASGDATFRNITLTGAVLAGAWNGSTITVPYGGTGAVTLTGYVKGNGTAAMTASATIPSTDITGLGTMSVQNANAVTISGGTISGLSAAIPVASGGTGAATLTGYVKGNGTSLMTASATIPNTDITGLGTMSTQGADAVTITGGTANGLTIGASNPAAATVTTLRINSTLSLAGATGTAGQVLTSNGASAPTWATPTTGTVTSVAALTLGTTGTDLSSTVATGTTTPVITLNVPTASATNRGVLSSADWSTFNNKGSGTITSVTGTAPVVSSGGTTPAISMAAATTSVNGYLTSTDWNTFNNKGSGSVTSVAGTGTVNGLTLTGTVTSSGSLTLGGTLDLSSPPAIGNTTAAAGTFTTLRFNSTLSANGLTGTAGQVLTSNGASAPTWQSVGGVGTVTSVNGSGGTTGLTLTGGPITSSGTLTLGGTLAVANGGTGVTALGTGVVTALGVNTGTAGSFVVNGGALGTPSSGTVTNLTGTASININGTVGATTPTTVVATQVDITAQGDLRLQDTTGGEYVALQAPGTLASSYTLTLPVDDGTAGQALVTDGSGVLSWSTAASGDVYGPASATDNAVARFDSTTGKIIQNSVVTIADTTGNMAGVGTLSSGAITSSALTSGRVPYAGTAGLIQDSANLTFDGTNLTVNGTAYLGGTSTTQSLRVAPVASAVNYLQIQGAATGGLLYVTSQGSDTNVGIAYQTKGTGFQYFVTGGTTQFIISAQASAVNYIGVQGGTTGNAAIVYAQGSDTNINLTLTPKGTGGVQFTGPLLPNNLAGTSGQVLTSAGAGAVPTWTTPSSGGVTAGKAIAFSIIFGL